jgi:hypothetical protein
MGWTRFLARAAALLASALFLAGCGKDDPKDPIVPELPSGWQTTFAAGSMAGGNSVVQTADGGYAIAGWTRDATADLISSVLLLRTDDSGNLLWKKVFEAPYDARGVSVLQTPDGGYLVLANYLGHSGEFWLIRTDSDGNMLWNQFKGYSDRDEAAEEALMTADGGYAFIGTTHHDNTRDVWLLRTGSNGESRWNRTLGYSDSEEIGSSLQQTADGGYLLVGYTTRAEGPHVWLVKTFADGSTHWHETIDIGEPATGVSICKTADGAYVIMAEVGQMLSDQRQIQLFRYDDAGHELWRAAHDSPAYYTGGAVHQTGDGGFMVATSRQPSMSNFGDFCLIRFDGAGQTLWSKTYGAGFCQSGIQTADGGYILCGDNATSTRIRLVKTDPDGNV